MKPTLPLRTPSSKDDPSDTTPARRLARTESGEQVTTPLSPSTARPQLLRSPLARVSSVAQEQDDGPSIPRTATAARDPLAPSSLSHDGAEDPGLTRAEVTTPDDGTVKGKSPDPSPDEETLAKLRDAVSAKMLLQQRMRTSHDTRRPAMLRDNPEAARPLSTVSNSSAMTSTSTASTESAKTIRGSVPTTPSVGGQPLRTPSYPFPYVPGTPRTWSSSFHQPFTSLSPTVSSHFGADRNTPGADSTGLTSGGSTPAAAPAMFAPYGAPTPRPEDPRFPTPNLYNLVLQLSAEPGLDAWWAAVANIMHDHYKAERVALAMPADPTDIENVPWGQKATFSMSGREEFVPESADQETTTQSERPHLTLREPSGDALSDVRPQKLHPERLRPRLDARHSYAGQARDIKDTTLEPAKTNERPAGLQRSFTYAPGGPTAPAHARLPAVRMPSASSVRTGSLADLEFSSDADGVDSGPYAAVFPVLRALDQESHPLIESGGINRVLERGRVVTVTRDYIPEPEVQVSSSTVATPNESATNPITSDPRPSRSFGNYRQVLAQGSSLEAPREYEEYEQHPASPWTQSPAPSPAIQSDEDQNPFFANEEEQVEDSFNPVASPQDYTQFGQVEAIGVDQASTVLHVPLVHPTLSQPMQSLRFSGSKNSASSHSEESPNYDRRAPIAVLSILGTPVPYPPSLIQSLQHLGPHLATSLSNAQSFSAGANPGLSIRHRRSASGRNVVNSPMTIEPTTLDEIVNADLEDPSSAFPDNMTSPSDYSGRSKHSPGSSIVGTPGWDPATHGWTSSRSAGGTPGVHGSDMIDNYFDAKKRGGHRPSSSNTGATAQTTPVRAGSRKFPGQEGKSQADNEPPRSDRKLRFEGSATDLKSPRRPLDRDKMQAKFKEAVASPSRPDLRHTITQLPGPGDKNHSYLHSYGADFQASFSALSAMTPGGGPNVPTPVGHTRKSSLPDEMPPPSERLLRTIIDSLPVQIFTAEPETGNLTWVNSKFLIYRGQDSRQVLSEPWQAIHPEDRTEYMDTWNRSLRTGQQLQQKVRLQRFDGKYRWFYVRAAPLKDKRQNIVHWIGTNMDFHEQHVAELNLARQQEMAASEAKYRALANSSPQIVFAVDRTKGVTFCNSQWVGFSGQTEGQALGVGFMDHVHPEDLAKCRLPTFDEGASQPNNVPTNMPPEPRRSKSMSVESSSGSSDTERGSVQENSPPPQHPPQRKLSELASMGILKVARDTDGRPSYSTEVRLRSKDGDFRWHLVRILLAEPLLQADEVEETWYGTCTDINDHKTLERDLKETMDEKSRFLSNMSHEIRTPLNGITGMVNFLIDSNLSTEQMEHVSIIRASTEGLRGLINDILDLSKAEAGMIQLNMDWMYVRALIEEVNDLTSTMAIDKGLELNYVVDGDVPTQFKGDRFRLRQILLNVVGNAIKFTQDGEVFVHCSIQKDEDHELTKHELFVKFQVTDTGRGFTDKEADALFKRFSQIDGSSTRQHGGTGLGLVISRQLAHLHGGDMSATGIPNKGSTFTFFVKTTLPSRDDKPPTPEPTPMVPSIPIFPMVASPFTSTPSETPEMGPTPGHKLVKVPSIQSVMGSQAKNSPKAEPGSVTSPSFNSPDYGKGSPTVSSAGSELSAVACTNSSVSERSSASSYVPDSSLPSTTSMKLNMPSPLSPGSRDTGPDSNDSHATIKQGSYLQPVVSPPASTTPPPMFSILVVAPLRYSRQATVQHIEKTLPSNVPHQITSRDNLGDCEKMLSGADPVVFSHVVMVLKDVHDIIALIDRILSTPAHSSTTIVIITDLAQKRSIFEQAKGHDYKSLESAGRVLFVFKPLKPSRFAIIFDPQKGREMSTDRNQDSAQQVAYNQKQVFAELSARLGKKDKRVLLVEDNRVNQMVILKFFSKVGIPVETVMDGVQCTEKVFAKPQGYFSLILVSYKHLPESFMLSLLTRSLRSAISTCPTKTATKRAKSCADGRNAPISPISPSSRFRPTSSATSTRSV
jgi:PAS domain S-box-containing protein